MQYLLEKIITILGPLLGVYIGWGLTTHSQRKKDLREDNRIRKEVIFYLLELRHLMLGLDMAPLKRLYQQVIKERIPGEYSPEMLESITDAFLPKMAAQLIQPIFQSKYPGIKTNFPIVVTKLSAVNPMLAFELSGREDMITHLDHFKNYLNECFKESESTPELVTFKKMLENGLDTEAITQTRDNIDELIFKLCEETGSSIGKNVREKLGVLDARYSNSGNELSDQIREALDRVGLPIVN